MNEIQKAVEVLQGAIATLQAKARAIDSMRPDCSAIDWKCALHQMMREFPDKDVGVEGRLGYDRYAKKIVFRWCIYDGNTHHFGKTLAEAMQKACPPPIESNEPDEPMEQAAAALDSMTPTPF